MTTFALLKNITHLTNTTMKATSRALTKLADTYYRHGKHALQLYNRAYRLATLTNNRGRRTRAYELALYFKEESKVYTNAAYSLYIENYEIK